mmetsp:Transcript_1296/g.3666  ORF Transcript_1296/g.3666 Transcript_1296/m.3666 type:complete len:483 (+) Transcript_1296:43-1491(+)
MPQLTEDLTPARVALEEASTYVERKKVFQLFESLLQDTLIAKPEEPIDYLIKLLKRPVVPRVVVAGPPGAQARSVCELLAAKQGMVHVIASDVWRELARLNFAPALEAKALIEKGSEVPDALLLEMLKEKLTSGECVTAGWVLEGFPSTPAQAAQMLKAGLLPTRFLHVTLTDDEVTRRLTGRRVDPTENQVYHVQDAPPPNKEVAARLVQREEDAPARVAQRLAEYRQSMSGMLPSFSKVTAEVDGALKGGIDAVIEAALRLISAEMPTRAPRGAPRVALLGGPGSGAESVGAAAASRYGAKLVSAIDLLHNAALSGNKVAKKAMETPEPLVIAEAEVGKLVAARLACEDVRTSGFVLVGYPFTASQASWLQRQPGIWLRDVVHLEMTDKDAEAAVCQMRYDPYDGEIYHLDNNPPAEPDTCDRLVTHPNHHPAVVKKALKKWKANKIKLLQAFKAELRTEDATRSELELVERLAPCFLSL